MKEGKKNRQRIKKGNLMKWWLFGMERVGGKKRELFTHILCCQMFRTLRCTKVFTGQPISCCFFYTDSDYKWNSKSEFFSILWCFFYLIFFFLLSNFIFTVCISIKKLFSSKTKNIFAVALKQRKKSIEYIPENRSHSDFERNFYSA